MYLFTELLSYLEFKLLVRLQTSYKVEIHNDDHRSA